MATIDEAWKKKSPRELQNYVSKMLPDHGHLDRFDWRFEPKYLILDDDKKAALAYLKSEHPMYLEYLSLWDPKRDNQPFIVTEHVKDGVVVDSILQEGNHRSAMAAIRGISTFRTIVGRQKRPMPWEQPVAGAFVFGRSSGRAGGRVGAGEDLSGLHSALAALVSDRYPVAARGLHGEFWVVLATPQGKYLAAWIDENGELYKVERAYLKAAIKLAKESWGR